MVGSDDFGVSDGCVDSALVGERRDCLVGAVAWYEASVVGLADSVGSCQRRCRFGGVSGGVGLLVMVSVGSQGVVLLVS